MEDETAVAVTGLVIGVGVREAVLVGVEDLVKVTHGFPDRAMALDSGHVDVVSEVSGDCFDGDVRLLVPEVEPVDLHAQQRGCVVVDDELAFFVTRAARVPSPFIMIVSMSMSGLPGSCAGDRIHL